MCPRMNRKANVGGLAVISPIQTNSFNVWSAIRVTNIRRFDGVILSDKEVMRRIIPYSIGVFKPS
jgi:hypothetical protein